MKFEHRNYGMSFQISKKEVPTLVWSSPNWFQRVILRQKPKPLMSLNDVCQALGAASRKYFEEQVKEMFK